jgi:hypothetical protein
VLVKKPNKRTFLWIIQLPNQLQFEIRNTEVFLREFRNYVKTIVHFHLKSNKQKFAQYYSSSTEENQNFTNLGKQTHKHDRQNNDYMRHLSPMYLPEVNKVDKPTNLVGRKLCCSLSLTENISWKSRKTVC